MPRNPTIRIRQKDVELIEKLNIRARRKQNRLSTKFNVNIDIPRSGVETFSTRSEFNKYVREIRAFTDYKAFRYVKTDNGAVLPRSVIQEAKEAVKAANKTRSKEAKRILGKEFTDRSIGSGFSVRESRYMMGDGRYQYLKPIKMNVNRFRSEKELAEFTRAIKEANSAKAIEKRNREFRANYLQALKTTYGKQSAQLRKAIKKLSLKQFMEIYYTENIAGFDFVYTVFGPPTELEELKAIFDA